MTREGVVSTLREVADMVDAGGATATRVVDLEQAIRKMCRFCAKRGLPITCHGDDYDCPLITVEVGPIVRGQ